MDLSGPSIDVKLKERKKEELTLKKEILGEKKNLLLKQKFEKNRLL
jgi:hypothetical protein